jgi:hypothetical protein
LKFLWEERAQHLTTYSNFWKQFYRKFPQYRLASVTAREFTAGERVEVDYAGDPIEWFDLKTGEIHRAWVFVAVLGFSQLLYARAAEDMQSRNWLGCHRCEPGSGLDAGRRRKLLNLWGRRVSDGQCSAPAHTLGGDGGKRTAADGAGATIGEYPDRSYPGKPTNLCRHRRSAPEA